MNQIQQKITYFKFIDRLIDLFLIVSSILLAIISENIYHQHIWYNYNIHSFSYYAFPFTIIISLSFTAYIERYFIYRITNYRKILYNVFLVTAFSLFLLIFSDFMLKSQMFYRTTILFYSIYLFSLFLIKRILYKLFLSNLRSRGVDIKNILIIGVNKATHKFIEKIQDHSEFGFKIIGLVYEQEQPKELNYDFLLIDIEKIDKVLMSQSIDEIFIINIIDRESAKAIIDKVENMGVNYHLVIDSDKFKISENSTITPQINRQYEMPTISFYSVNATFYKLVVKNFVERIFAFILFLSTLPLVIIAAIFIKLSTRGPVFFIQERVGLRNRRFKQYKLRTMIENADEKKKDLLHLNEQEGAAFKISNDPRVTKIGQILRKFSIDELPQLINVLKGEMNLIGPRPPIPSEVENYKLHYYRRFSFKPGITGLWQISGRNKIKNFEDWVKLDLEYIDNWSLTQDLIIALKTIPVILKGSGK